MMAASPTLFSDPAAAINVPWLQVERFLGLFTHDVRNGLNSLELQLTLLGEISDDPEVGEEVKSLRRSVADITRQLHSLRLATGVPSPHPFAYPAADFVEDLRERCERRFPEASARIAWNVMAAAGSLDVDPELSMTALLELLANALYHAAEGSTIRFQAGGDGTAVTFTIDQSLADAPAGSGQDWGRTPFTSTRRDGYGLGAFYAWRIIETQKGTLKFAYAEPEKSLVTTVVLPIIAAAKDAQ